MCALFGWYLPTSIPVEQRQELAMYLVKESTKLGPDSWGYAIPISPGRVVVARGLGRMEGHDQVDIKMMGAQSMLYGHCRRASVGLVTLANAHPFCVNHIVGAHNGEVSNWARLNGQYVRNCRVDSQHIFHHIAEKKSLRSIEGWGAVWYLERHKHGRVYIFRSQGGHFSVYGIGKNSGVVNGVVLASLSVDAERACKAAGLECFEYEFPSELLYYVEDYKLYKTTTAMAFGQPYSFNSYRHGDDYWTTRDTGACGYYRRRAGGGYTPTSEPISRMEREAKWEGITLKCQGCGWRFLTGNLQDCDGKQFCPNCMELAHAKSR